MHGQMGTIEKLREKKTKQERRTKSVRVNKEEGGREEKWYRYRFEPAQL
jgi:hypothetical protein